jgi:hypothetical protein
MHPLTTVILADIGGLLFLPVGFFALAFWIWMIVDCARHETGSTLVAWLLLIIFAGVVGAPLYFFIRRVPRQQSTFYHPGSPVYQPWRKNQRLG